MNTKRSYLDQLNQGRSRRPDAALDDLSRSLAELEQRLDQHARGGSAMPRAGLLRASTSPSSLSSKATGSHDHDWAERLSGDFSAKMGELRKEITRLGPSIADNAGRALKSDFVRIAAAVEALASKDTSQAVDSLQREVEAVSRELGNVARQDTLAELGKRWSALEESISIQKTDEAPIERLYARMEEIADAIGRIPQNINLAGMEEKLRTLATAVDHFARHQDLAAPSTISLLDERLDEISRAIAASGRVANFDARPIERIEAQMADLSKQLGEISSDGSVDIFARINELLDRVDHLAQKAAWPQEAVTALSQQLERIGQKLDQGATSPEFASHVVEGIAERIDGLAASVERERLRSDEMMSAFASNVHDRFDALTEQLETRGASYDLPQVLDDRLNALAERLDRFAPVDSAEMFETIEARLRDVLIRLDEQDNAQAAMADTALLESLHQQITSLSQALEAEDGVLPRLTALERFQETAGDLAVEAARLAAEGVIRGGISSVQDGARVSDLADGLRSLEAVARETDARNARSFDAIHSTLLQIADRLSGTERAFAPRAQFEEEPIETRMRKVLKQSEPLPEFDVEPPSTQIGVEPVSVHEPLEPGSGTPNLNAIMRRVREDNARDAHVGSPDVAKADFIAAARRAAQAAASDTDVLRRGTEKSESGLLGRLFRGRKKTMLLAATGILVALAGVQLTSALLLTDRGGAKVAFTMPVDDAEPAAARETVLSEPADGTKTPEREIAANTQPMPTYTPPAQTIAPATASAPQEAELDMMTVASTEGMNIAQDAGPLALREAAEAGDASALYEIGARYAEGRGNPQDDAQALQWFTKSAEADFALAQYRLGNAYEKGIGTERDLDLARQWYEKAAIKGNASAMHNLAVLYAMGTDGKTDNRAAVRWFREAADRGIKDSQFNMGVLAAKGVGMEQSLEESYQWFDVVARTGDKDAARKRDEIAKSMRPEELDRAKARTQLWKQKTLDKMANEFSPPDAWREENAPTASADAPVDMKKAIMNVQKILIKNGYDTGTPDGMIGERTRKAISAFQKDNGLTSTGDITPDVLQALLAKNS
ncbi:SEL1-like repeat protein [Limoniibacter endophyticus]|uniref:Peptidoglycan-binding protein n=1 Tax=Limoniibacter endophyticus TaxID=1565040 RepID=A0A8J3DH95_9HYPH|nr:SEL1-like repeat protein [Limoniibacter endophyticus]GHC66510.1 peptidoglycan-binding protein [Limoniibacter endophyticus]